MRLQLSWAEKSAILNRSVFNAMIEKICHSIAKGLIFIKTGKLNVQYLTHTNMANFVYIHPVYNEIM